VTSRPDCVIDKSPLFEAIDIAPLMKSELTAFFEKILSKDKELVVRLKKAIESAPLIASLVSTPLLATLLTIVYRAHQKIPLDFSEFYEELFAILLVRHDRSKVGYERFRKTGLTDREIETVFEAFCFRTRILSKNSLTRTEALLAAKEAIAMTGLSCKEDMFLADVSKITCLLSFEGDRYEFVHQSVQEFFASGYIKTRPDLVAQKFYEQLLIDGKWSSWLQELVFLAQRDKFRSSKYFYSPAFFSTLSFLSSEVGADVETLSKLITDQEGVVQKTSVSDGQILSTPKYFIRTLRAKKHYMEQVYFDRVNHLLFRSAPSSTKWATLFDKKTENQFLTYTEISKQVGVVEELNQLLSGTSQYLRKELEMHRSIVKNFEDSAVFVSI
jgi:hypothetical protein